MQGNRHDRVRNSRRTEELYSRAVGHKTSLYLYGGESIKGERIAICPGGGNDMAVLMK